MASDERYIRARHRARTAVYARLCCGEVNRGDLNAIAEWVCTKSCEAERNLRMLTVELAATHLRTGMMSPCRLLTLAKWVHEFAIEEAPDKPVEAPVSRRDEDRPERARRKVA